ncbi:MAG: zinc ribbon domain-containing protein [Spirochaetaceae bacterium]|nr:MAG: zinc ribbon domain-containing protein [Spirochaetaceae bacterium]
MTIVLFIVVSAVLGWMIGSSKGKGGAGLALGIFLGPLGVLIALFLKADTQKVEATAIQSGESKKCPFCSELIKVDAVVCRFCGRDLPVPGTAMPEAPGVDPEQSTASPEAPTVSPENAEM